MNMISSVLADHAEVAAEIVHWMKLQVNTMQPTRVKGHMDDYTDTFTDPQILNQQMDVFVGSFTANPIHRWCPHEDKQILRNYI